MVGPRTKHKDNSHPLIKIKLRRWVLEKIEEPKVLDLYGGYGYMYEKVWREESYSTSEGDAIEWLKNKERLSYSVYDVDPYSSPYEALNEISKKTTNEKIAIICTDGFLKRQAQMRGNFTSFICKLCNWPKKDNNLMADIYYNYERYLKYIIQLIFANYKIQNMAVKTGRGFGKNATVYFAIILKKVE